MSEEDRSMCLKTYKVNGEVLVAVCDGDLIGRKFSEGELQLEVSSEFFGEYMASSDEVGRALADATMANFVGERAVSCAIELDFVNGENVLRIEGVPCAQMVQM